MSRNKHQPPQPRGSQKTIETDSASAIQYLLDNTPELVQSVFTGGLTLNPRLEELLKAAKQNRIIVDTSPSRERKMKARVLVPPMSSIEDAVALGNQKEKVTLIALDHLQDPQNFGALCRTVEALGGDGIIIPKDRMALLGEGALSASVGTVAKVPLYQVSNLTDAILKLKKENFWIYGTSLSETSVDLETISPSEKSVIVLGTEWEGLSPNLEKHCDFLMKIPIHGKVDSLNVSVAGAIFLYQFLRGV